MHAIRGGRGKVRTTGRKLAAWLALFSLFLQLWVTAGHFHPEDFATLYRSDLAQTTLAAPGDDRGTVPLGATAHDDCALCLTVQLTGNSTLAAAPVLTAPAAHPHRPAAIVRAFHLTATPHLLFETRAPPIA